MPELDLAVIETHPIQYRAPIYRELSRRGLRVHVLYGSDCSVVGYEDPGFRRHFAWDQDLLEGYDASFLGKSSDGYDSPEHATTDGLAQRLKQLAPRAVLVTGYSPAFHRRALERAWAARARVLLRAESTDTGYARPALKRYLRDAWLRRVYARCDALLYVGRRAYEHYRRLGVPEAKLHFSPYAVDDRAFQPSDDDRARLRSDTRARLGCSDGELVLLFSGKLIPRKNPLALVEAAALLPAELRDRTSLCFLGDGELRARASQAAQAAGIRHTLVGFVNQTGLSAYYHAADLLVVPSDWETWGLVVNDALHHGLPCVTSFDVDAAADLITPETGTVYRTGDSQDLARAIERALPLVGSAPARAACRARVSRYSVKAAADGIAAALHPAAP